jgi:hypothetical protein
VIQGRYSLDREIGRGGTGAVWLGHDRLLGRQVALKRLGLLPGAEETDQTRAEREAHLSARLNHPHVVAVFDVVDDHMSGDQWLVMEYVDGGTLSRLVHERGALAPEAAAPLLRQVADALIAAHAAGITHRDVKPSNILVDDRGRAKLTDFGIARAQGDPSLTQTGVMTGSPAYLAPEVASGGRGDAASDVWSLGATAFHVLSGRPPYDSAGNVLGTLYRIVHEDPPRLADAGWMAPLLEGTMVKDPSLRWSMTEVRDFLALPRPVVAVPTVVMASPETVDPVETGHTRVLPMVGTGAETPAAAAPLVAPRAPGVIGRRRPPGPVLASLGAVAVLLLVVALAGVLDGGGRGSGGDAKASETRGAAVAASAHPTAAGMESFIRDYVATVSADPDAAWAMLTAKFQRESGGLERYRSFWAPATNGKVLSISADPAHLSVSYHVHFDDFDNGPGPTVLDLTFANGHYLIDGERTKGFHPAG